jgi:NAD(P)-dependent dehydrogenase (short-subunit alcohol dehydrogenase family)
MGSDRFSFHGKSALVVGGASGMGLAAAQLVGELGATVTIADVKAPGIEVGAYRPLDLRDRVAIEAFVDGLDGPIDAVLSCAGVADGTPGLPQVNFIGQRHLIERLLDRGLLHPGAAISMISSIGGIGWRRNLETIGDFLDTTDFDAASAWIDVHPELAGYGFSKEAMIVYCARRAPELVRRGIRINCIAPGPTLTPLMAANESWVGFEQGFQSAMGHPGATSEEQAYPLVFLASDAASHISGTCLVVDLGFTSGGMVGAVESPILDMLLQ